MPRPRGHGPNFEGRRQEIIDHAARLFAKRGYAATGVSTICREVKLGKGALYYYIGSKEKLLVEIQNRVLAPVLAETERIDELDVSAMVRLRLVSQHLLTVIFDRLDHIWVYEHDYRHLSKPNRRRVLDQRHEFEHLVRSMLEQAMDAGEIERADGTLAMLQFLNLHNHTFQWARPGQRWTPATLSPTYFRTLMLGFGAEPATVRRAEDEALLLLDDNAPA
ncbi:TetR/AcrR family transcriptional regulator [Spirillospora sp. NPDC047418]